MDLLLILIALVAQLWDVGTTYVGLRSGRCYEAVWPTQRVWLIALFKLGGWAFCSYALTRFDVGGLRVLFLVGLVGMAVSGLIAGTLNYHRCIR